MKNKLIFNDVTLPKGATLKDYAEAFQREFERIKKELDTPKLRKKIKAYPIKDFEVCNECKGHCSKLCKCSSCTLANVCYCATVKVGEPCKRFERK